LLKTTGKMAKDERKFIRAILKTLKTGQTSPWPEWRWQNYDDAFRILILFKP